MIHSVPHLFALASNSDCIGSRVCFYCGSSCDESHPTRSYVADTFTGIASVARPGSPWVCNGCVLCLREDAEIPQIDGTFRRITKAAVRMHSWVITRASARGALKSHLAELRAVCLSSPPPPFAIVLTDSGQTHQLYRGVVNHDTAHVAVTLEGEPIRYAVDDLRSRLELAGKVAAACGKPVLTEEPELRHWSAIMERYAGGEAIIDQWSFVRQTPIFRLAAWLCPNKETSENEFPATNPTAG